MNLTAVHLRNLLHHGQADTEAVRRVDTSFAIEKFEDVRQRTVVDATTIAFHTDDDRCLIDHCAELYPAADLRELGGVVQEIAEQLIEALVVRVETRRVF